MPESYERNDEIRTWGMVGSRNRINVDPVLETRNSYQQRKPAGDEKHK